MAYRFERQWWCKKHGNKVIDRENEIGLYFAHSCSKMCILTNVLNIGLFHFHGQSPCFRAFCTTIVFQTYMPPINFLVENVFIYLYNYLTTFAVTAICINKRTKNMFLWWSTVAVSWIIVSISHINDRNCTTNHRFLIYQASVLPWTNMYVELA